jgi:hypothetical protein
MVAGIGSVGNLFLNSRVKGIGKQDKIDRTAKVSGA